MTLNNSQLKNKLIAPIIIGVIILLTSLIFTILDALSIDEFMPIKPGETKYVYSTMHNLLGPAYDLFYFTFQTNFFLGICFIIFGIHHGQKYADTLFVVSICYITITFLLFWAAIAPVSALYKWKTPYWTINNVFMHLVNPLYGFVYFGIIKNKLHIDAKIIRWCSLYLPLFVILAAIIYATGSYSEIDQSTGELINYHCYIYKFLDFKEPLFIPFSENLMWLAMLVDIVILLISPYLFLEIAWLFIKLLKIDMDGSIFKFKKIKQYIQIENQRIKK